MLSKVSNDQPAAVSEMEKRILAAAEHCFREYSIQKTKIDDICMEAGISRPSFYRFYKNKQDLLLFIAQREIVSVVQRLDQLIEQYDDIEEVFVEAIMICVLDFPKSETVRFLLGTNNLEFTLKEVNKANLGTSLHLELGWKRIIEVAHHQGRLRENFSAEEMVDWLQLLETLLIVSGEILETPEEKLRCQVRAFVVPALLTP